MSTSESEVNHNNRYKENMKRKLREDGQPNAKHRDEVFSQLRFSIPPSSMSSFPRMKCPRCERNRRYYCYDCMSSITPPNTVPHITLPMKAVIIQHPGELKGKSTAIHAKVICPESVDVYQYPMIPDFINKDNAVLVYPSKDAMVVSDLIQNPDTNQTAMESINDASGDIKFEYQYIVFIDSTWQQSKAIFRDPRLQQLKHVKITEQKTLFWRYQQHGEAFLSTIEAIYYFYRELNTQIRLRTRSSSNDTDDGYNGEFDDLLFFYVFQYDLIQQHYKDNPQLSFVHKENYIKYAKPEDTSESGSTSATDK